MIPSDETRGRAPREALDLGEGLVMRWGRPQDTDALAAMQARLQSDDPGQPKPFVDHWVRDLMGGQHPAVGPHDFTVVVDTRADPESPTGGRIVSSACLIPQTWVYDEVTFGVGRPELVATEPSFRRTGLVRRQLEWIHAESRRRGHLVQIITGIPYYYRQFGYTMALHHAACRLYVWGRWGNDRRVECERLRLREARPDDVTLLEGLYDQGMPGRVRSLRDRSYWLFAMSGCHRDTPGALHLHIIESDPGEPVGYVEYRCFGQSLRIRELAVREGRSLRDVGQFLTRRLRAVADSLSQQRDKPVTRLVFGLGPAHPVYDALGSQLERAEQPYALYVRMPDVKGFLARIRPVLETRLAHSPLAGHTGRLRLDLYREQIEMVFEGGHIRALGPFEPKRISDGDAFFPPGTFPQLVFGHCSLRELKRVWPDVVVKHAEVAVLLGVLFPLDGSEPIPLS